MNRTREVKARHTFALGAVHCCTHVQTHSGIGS